MLRSRLPMLLFGILFQVPMLAQVTPQRDPQAVVLLQQSLNAMGAARALQVQDTLVQASVVTPEQGDASAPVVTIKTKGSDRIRWEGTGSNSATVTIQNRGRLIQFKDGRSVARPSANALHRRIEHLPVLFLGQELARGDVVVAYVGQETIYGRSAHRLRLTRQSTRGSKDLAEKLTKDSELEIFFDAQSLLPVKISYVYFSETDWRRGLPMEVFYNDYQLVDGLLLPFQQRTVFNGRAIYELRLRTFSANVGVADTEFEGR